MSNDPRGRFHLAFNRFSPSRLGKQAVPSHRPAPHRSPQDTLAAAGGKTGNLGKLITFDFPCCPPESYWGKECKVGALATL